MAILEVKNIKKSFGKNEILKGISFSLEKGEVLAVIGSSGGGKTTLCHLLPNFYKIEPENGSILIDGKDIRDCTMQSLRSNIGIVQQDIYLFNGKIKISKRAILATLLLLGGNLLFFFTVWLLSKYDNIDLDQVLFQMKSPASGAHKNLLSSAFFRVGVFGFALTGIEYFLHILLAGKFKKRLQNSTRYMHYCTTKVCRIFKKIALPFSAAMLLVAVLFFTIKLEVINYISGLTHETDFIKEQYVDPNTAKLTFPQEKRNLIYIFLESMENTYADTSAGGLITQNFIPELTKLAEENVSFSNKDIGLGGAVSYTGTTWTAAAMVSQTSGIVVKVPLSADTYGGEDEFIPGIVSIGEVLEQQGYRQTLLLGSDAAFAGRDSYFTEHGNYNIVDIVSLKGCPRITLNFGVTRIKNCLGLPKRS